MRFMRRGSDVNYRKSNAIRTIAFDVGDAAQALAARILAESAETGHRQILATELIDALSDAARIDICNVKVSEARQYHQRSGRGSSVGSRKGRIVMRQYGYYKPATKYVYITNRTAVRGQLLASKTFLETLLHEWMHHYDHTRLGLQSIHSSGFYARLDALRCAIGASKKCHSARVSQAN